MPGVDRRLRRQPRPLRLAQGAEGAGHDVKRGGTGPAVQPQHRGRLRRGLLPVTRPQGGASALQQGVPAGHTVAGEPGDRLHVFPVAEVDRRDDQQHPRRRTVHDARDLRQRRGGASHPAAGCPLRDAAHAALRQHARVRLAPGHRGKVRGERRRLEEVPVIAGIDHQQLRLQLHRALHRLHQRGQRLIRARQVDHLVRGGLTVAGGGARPLQRRRQQPGRGEVGGVEIARRRRLAEEADAAHPLRRSGGKGGLARIMIPARGYRWADERQALRRLLRFPDADRPRASRLLRGYSRCGLLPCPQQSLRLQPPRVAQPLLRCQPRRHLAGAAFARVAHTKVYSPSGSGPAAGRRSAAGSRFSQCAGSARRSIRKSPSASASSPASVMQ